MSDWKKYTQSENWHPAAKVFPILPENKLREMAADIEANGLQNPIALFEDQVLDGRNRLLACQIAGVEPQFYEWQPEGRSPLTWVLSQNTHRRHLTQGQKAFVALAVEELLAVEARKRQGARNDIVEIIPQSEAGKSRDQAAKVVGVNPHYVTDAKRLAKEAPELAEKVKSGDLSLPEAKREMKPALAKADKPHDAEWRWRKVDSLVINLYGELPVEQRAKEVRVLAERLRGKYLSLPNVSEEAA